jgi:hypothetical protein
MSNNHIGFHLRAAAVFAVLSFAAPATLLAQTAAPAAPAAPPSAATTATPATPPTAPAPVKTKKSKKAKKAAAEAASAASPASTAPTAPTAPAAAATAPASPAAAGAAVFPSAVSPKYATQKAGDARMHTCLDQYHANKAANGNGGLKWIQKGGGYYSECSKKLKA